MQQRPIKFRAWDTVDKAWIKPSSFYVGGEGDLLSYGARDDTGGFPNEIALEQFTGLLDKNGKEIYEGDILKFPSGAKRTKRIASVTWNEDGATYQFDLSATSLTGFFVERTDESEVIGNIHENPDLLESGKASPEA